MSNWTENKKDKRTNPVYDPSKHEYKKGWIDGHPSGGYPSNYFFADTIRAVLIGFGNFFSNLFVIRYDEKGEPIKQIQVPLKYGPRMKSHDFRVEQESGKKYYIQLPNLTYRIDGLAFAGERAAGSLERRGFYSNYFEVNGIDYIMANKFWADVHPVPYNLTISMEAKTEHISDANQILEQVLVRFAPEAYFDLKEFWFINKRRSIKMKCDSSNIEINTDFGEEDKREITVSFTFTVEAWLYKPIENTTIIDQIVTKLGVNNENNYYKEVMKGNFNGSFDSRYDLSYEFGTKIGKVSALLPYEDQPVPVQSTTGIYEQYEYEELPDITNYPVGSKLLVAQNTIFDEDQSVWNGYDQYLQPLSSTAPVSWVDKTYGETGRNAAALQYWEVTAYGSAFDPSSPTSLKPSMSGDKIYQIFKNRDFVIEPGTMKKVNGKTEPDKPGVFGATIIKEYENLKGFGNFSDNLFFGTKDAEFDGEVVKDAPWVSQVTINKDEIL
jgi:hypothetical protein